MTPSHNKESPEGQNSCCVLCYASCVYLLVSKHEFRLIKKSSIGESFDFE